MSWLGGSASGCTSEDDLGFRGVGQARLQAIGCLQICSMCLQSGTKAYGGSGHLGQALLMARSVSREAKQQGHLKPSFTSHPLIFTGQSKLNGLASHPLGKEAHPTYSGGKDSTALLRGGSEVPVTYSSPCQQPASGGGAGALWGCSCPPSL